MLPDTDIKGAVEIGIKDEVAFITKTMNEI
jgi:hypothetical protein